MPQLALDNFNGIAPNRTSFAGRALIAENVDLSGGGIKPIKAPSYVESGHSEDFTFHNNQWVSGNENYLPSHLNGIPSLIYKRQGSWKISLNGESDHDLWLSKPENITVTSSKLPTPDAPDVAESGTGTLSAGAYEYFISFAEVDGEGNELRESDKSSASVITVSNGRVRAARPNRTGVPVLAKWRLWRRQQGNTYVRLVGEANITEAFIYDESDETLGESAIPEVTQAQTREYRYVIVWARDLGGWVHESIPSDPFAISQSEEGVKIQIDGEFPVGVNYWRIYRISLGFEPTTTFQLVDTIDINTKEYVDVKDNVELTNALASSYRAENGALVSAGVPDSQFDGMAGPFNGFYVGWIGRDLYLSEPGNPTWWPGAFVVQANFDISSVTQVGGNLAVVTEGGVQFGYGLTPDSFTLSQSIFGSGGVGLNNSDKNYYLAYNGIYQVSESGVTLVTPGFDKEYFDALDTQNSTLIQEKERLFLFHDQGALVYDFVSQQWTTLSPEQHTFDSVHRSGGEVYGLRNGTIVKLFGSDDDAPWEYKAALTFGDPSLKHASFLRFYGEGSCNVEMSTVEDVDTVDSSGEVDMDSLYEPDGVIYPPAWIHTEAIMFRVSGKATVRSIMFNVDKVNSET